MSTEVNVLAEKIEGWTYGVAFPKFRYLFIGIRSPYTNKVPLRNILD